MSAAGEAALAALLVNGWLSRADADALLRQLQHAGLEIVTRAELVALDDAVECIAMRVRGQV